MFDLLRISKKRIELMRKKKMRWEDVEGLSEREVEEMLRE